MATKFSVFAPFLWALQQTKKLQLKGLVVNGDDLPLGGSGIEFSGGPSAKIQAYNRDTDSYIQLNYESLAHVFWASGPNVAFITDIGIQCLVGSLKPPQTTLSTLPSASTHAHGLIVVTDASGGPALCISDGTNWRRVSDNTTVS